MDGKLTSTKVVTRGSIPRSPIGDKRMESRVTQGICSNCQRGPMSLYDGLCINFCWNRSEDEKAEEINRVKLHKELWEANHIRRQEEDGDL